ncbi:hypothetical protein LTR66_000525 [Elasticomyces elasticus]|nr:hypothetical protein LTR66_000525 [Elasticomyces elasticus]
MPIGPRITGSQTGSTGPNLAFSPKTIPRASRTVPNTSKNPGGQQTGNAPASRPAAPLATNSSSSVPKQPAEVERTRWVDSPLAQPSSVTYPVSTTIPEEPGDEESSVESSAPWKVYKNARQRKIEAAAVRASCAGTHASKRHDRTNQDSSRFSTQHTGRTNAGVGQNGSIAIARAMNNMRLGNRSAVSKPANRVSTYTNRTGRTTRGYQRSRFVYNGEWCKLSGGLVDDYVPGDIISAPQHLPNLDKSKKPYSTPIQDKENQVVEQEKDTAQAHANDKNLASLVQTELGPIISKRRMFVVLRCWSTGLFVVPIFSHNGVGLRNKSDAVKAEYVCFRGGKDWENESIHDPLDTVEMQYRLSNQSSVHVCSPWTIRPDEDI